MAFSGEGKIEIPLEDFWGFVRKYLPKDIDVGTSDGGVAYGVPHVLPGGCDLVIDVAFSSECDPNQWSEKPAAVTQWADLRKGG